MLSLIPWRFVAGALVALAVIAAAFGAIEHFGRSRFDAGRAQVQAEVDSKTESANAAAREVERAHTEQVNAISNTYESRLAATGAAVTAAVSVGDRLRDQIRTASSFHAPDGDPATASADGRAAALGGLLESCSRLAEDSSADAERLADQLRSLQSYALIVSGKTPSATPQE